MMIFGTRKKNWEIAKKNFQQDNCIVHHHLKIIKHNLVKILCEIGSQVGEDCKFDLMKDNGRAHFT